MVHITPEATGHLVRLRLERGIDESHGARFVRNGARIGLTFAKAPEPDDRVVSGPAIDVYVAPEIAAVVDESIIDARDDDGKTALVLRQQPDRTEARANGG